MKEVYELWSFCIHSLRLTAPALAALADLVALADPVALVVLVALVALVVLAALADPVVLADLAAPVVPRPWVPRSPVWHRNSRTLAMPRTLRR